MLVGAGMAMAGATADRQRIPLADRHKDAGLACADCHGQGPKKPVEMATCLGCHESYRKVAERTGKWTPNPHDNHLVDLECTKCHLGHKAQENYCETCHSEMAFTPNQ
jgi:fumarate reductase flavoprotein subunit